MVNKHVLMSSDADFDSGIYWGQIVDHQDFSFSRLTDALWRDACTNILNKTADWFSKYDAFVSIKQARCRVEHRIQFLSAALMNPVQIGLNGVDKIGV